jgi:hypothetical protein
MAASHRHGSSLTGIKQADIIECGLAVWWLQSHVPADPSVARLNWLSVYQLLATEALEMLDQGPPPVPASNLPVSFQAFLTELDALDEGAQADAAPRNLEAALNATAAPSRHPRSDLAPAVLGPVRRHQQ